MKIKIAASVVGVLIALSIIGAATIWAQGGGPTPTPSTPAAPNYCEQYMQALAQRLGVSVERLTQAGKDTAKDVIDQAVKDGRLTAEQAAEAKQRIDQATGGCSFKAFGHRGFGFFGLRGFGFPRQGRVITGTRAIEGAAVTSVVADSPAAKAGVQVRDVILAVDGQNVDSQHLLNALIQQKKPGDSVALRIQRGSDIITVNVTLGASPNNASVAYLGIQFAHRPRTSQTN